MAEAVEVRKQDNGYVVTTYAYSQAEAQHLMNLLLGAKPPESFIPVPQQAPELPVEVEALVVRIDEGEAE